MTLCGGDGGLEVSALNAVGREVGVRLCYWSKASLLKKLSPHTQECTWVPRKDLKKHDEGNLRCISIPPIPPRMSSKTLIRFSKGDPEKLSLCRSHGSSGDVIFYLCMHTE